MRERLIKLIMSTPKKEIKINGRANGKTYQTAGNIADYLIANGVIVPPCKVGDTVYWLDDGKIKCEEVFEISIHSDGILVHTGIQFCLSQVFLTREEAEKALKEREGGMMKCFYCGKRETSRNPFYRLDNDGHEICQSCMQEGYWKSALEIIEHNKQVDMRKEDEGK